MAEELIIKVKTDGTAQVVGDLNKLGNGVGETAAKTKTASEVMKGAFGAIASSFLVLKGLEFGKSMLSSMMSANAFMESSVTQLKVLTKSAATAKAMLVDLKRFADVTPFETADIVQAGKLMTTFGLNYKAFLREAGDMAAAFSSNSGEMKQNLLEIISAMGRIKAGQMGESMEILRRFGVGRDTLEQMGLKFNKGGQYLGDAETFLRALRNLIHKNYSGMMDQMSKTWEGTMSNLRAHFENAAQMVGKEFFDKMKVEGQGLLQWLDKMRDSGQLEEWAKKTGAALADVFDKAVGLAEQGKKITDWWNNLGDTAHGFAATAIKAGGAVWVLEKILALSKSIAATNIAAAFPNISGGVAAGAGLAARATAALPVMLVGIASGVIVAMWDQFSKTANRPPIETLQQRKESIEAQLKSGKTSRSYGGDVEGGFGGGTLRNLFPREIEELNQQLKETKDALKKLTPAKQEILGPTGQELVGIPSTYKNGIKIIKSLADIIAKADEEILSKYPDIKMIATAGMEPGHKDSRQGAGRVLDKQYFDKFGKLVSDAVMEDIGDIYRRAGLDPLVETRAKLAEYLKRTGKELGSAPNIHIAQPYTDALGLPEPLFMPGTSGGGGGKDPKKLQELLKKAWEAWKLNWIDIPKEAGELTTAQEYGRLQSALDKGYVPESEKGAVNRELAKIVGSYIGKKLLSAREAVDEAAKTQEEAVKAWQEHMEQYFHFGTYSEMYGANPVQISAEEMRRRWRQIDEARASAPFIRREVESPAELLKPGVDIGESDRYFEGYLDSYRQFLDDLMQQSGNFNDFMKDTWGNIRRYIADTFAFQAFKPLAQMLSETTSGIFGNMLGGEQKAKESKKEAGKEAGKEIAKGFDLAGIFGKAGAPGGVLSSLFTAGIGGLISGALGAIFGSNPSYNPPPEVQPWESNEMLRLRSAEGTASYDVQPYLDAMREWTSRLDMLASSRNTTTDLLNQLLAQTPTVPSSTGFTLPASAFSSPTGIQLSQIMQGASSSSVSSATNAYYQELIGQGQTILEDALADMAPRDWMADAIANTRTIIQEFAVKFKEGNETARNIWDYFLEQFSEVINQGGGITQLSVTNPFTGAVTRATINPDGSISTGSTTGGTSTGTPINGNEVDIGLFTGETAGTSISNLTGSSAMSALQVEALIGIQEKLATGLTFDADFITALQKDTWNVNIQRIDPQIMSRFMAAAYSAGGPTGGATGGTTGATTGGTPTGAGATTGGTTGAGMPQFSAIGANSPFLYNGVYYYYSTDGSLNGNWPNQNAAQAAIQAYSTSSIASYVSGISSTVASNGIMNGVQFIGGLEAQNNALSGLAEAYAAAGITNPYTTQVSGIEGLAKGISGGNSGSQISVSITGPIQLNPNSTGGIDKAIMTSLNNYTGTQLIGAVVI